MRSYTTNTTANVARPDEIEDAFANRRGSW